MLLTHWWSKWSKYAQHGQCLFLSRDHYKLTSPAQSLKAFTSSFMFTWLIVPLVPTEQPWQCFELLEVTLHNPGLAHVHPRLPDGHHLMIGQSRTNKCKEKFHLCWEIEESINMSFTSRRRHLLFYVKKCQIKIFPTCAGPELGFAPSTKTFSSQTGVSIPGERIKFKV